jgi:Leucine-rich repeat (LRR) protein
MDSIYSSDYPHSYNKSFQTNYDLKTGRLTALQIIGLGLSTLPPEIALLDSLKLLDLSHNKLIALPGEVTLLKLADSSFIIHDNKITSQTTAVTNWINKYTCEEWFERQYTNINSAYPKDSTVIRNILNASGFESVGVRLVTHVKSSRLYSFSWPYYYKLITVQSQWGELLAFQPVTKRMIYADSLSKCSELVKLDLNIAQIGTIPPDIFKLINLKVLILTGNELTAIQPEIGNLVNLEFIRLCGNYLTNLPTSIITLTKLTQNKLQNMDAFCSNYINPSSQEVINWLNEFGIDYWRSCQNDTMQ